MHTKAIGTVETYGLLAAVSGCDSALKAANVTLCSFNYVKGGLVAFTVQGDVGAVKAATQAGVAEAARLGRLSAVSVIPRPIADIERILPLITPRDAAAKVISDEPVESADVFTAPEITAVADIPDIPVIHETTDISVEMERLAALKLSELRQLAAETDGVNLSIAKIKLSNKSTLIKAILEAQESK